MRMVLNMSDVNRKRITIVLVCMILLQRAGQKPGNNIFDYFLHQPGADGLGIAKIEITDFLVTRVLRRRMHACVECLSCW